MARSILAIVVGFIFIGVLAFGTEAALHAAMPGEYGPGGRLDSFPLLLFTQLYVFVYAVAGCYLAAWMAGRKPMQHALILGVLGLVFNVIGSVSMWDTAPAWYHIVAILLVMPAAWLGGKIRERQLQPSGARLAPAGV
jgi:hypothetical protein